MTRRPSAATLFIRLTALTFVGLAVTDWRSPTRAATPASQPAAAPSPLPRGPVLTGEDGQPVKGVKLARADVTAVVDGPLAEATMLLTFANDQPQVLGGELVFPLPEGATVTGYGLDVNGVMVDGVAVEKQRARIIYEQELHKRVDPGLVEHVAGNAFRTRLYPVPANGTRRVKIQYLPTVDLAGDKGDAPGKASLTLPVAWADVVDKVSVRVEVRGAAAAPVIAGAAGDQPGLKVEKAAGAAGFVVAGDVPTAALRDGFTVLLPALPNQSVSVQKRPRLAASVDELEQQRADEKAGDPAKTFGRSEHFFVLTDVPQATPRKAAQLKSRRIGVAWDASLSRAGSDHARELKVLQAILERFGNPAVDVVVVRNDIEVIRGPVGGGVAETAKVLETLRGLAYDGATDLGRLILPKNQIDYLKAEAFDGQGPPDYDLFLLFTDGMGNLGGPMPTQAAAPVYALSDDDRVNYPALRALCRQSGGAYFDLRRATDDQVLAAVGDRPFSFVSAEFDPAQVAEVYPGPGTPVGGRFALAGKLLVPEAKVTVNYGYGKDVTHSETFTVKAEGAADGTLLPRFWAQQKVAELSLLPEKNAEELEKVGRQFNLVTPNTSLLVLETADQYVQYRVVPPKDRADVYNEFLAKIDQNKAQEQQTKEQKLQQVAAAWQQRVAWWEKEYKYPPDLKFQLAEGKVLARGAGPATTQPWVAGTDAPGEAAVERSAARAGQDSEQDRRQAEIARRIGNLANSERQPADQAPAPAALPRPPGEHVSTIRTPAGSLQVRGTVVRSGDSAAPANPRAAQPGQGGPAAVNDPQDMFLRPTDDRDGTTFEQRNFDTGRADDEKGEKDGKGLSRRGLTVAVKAWDPATPYLAAMKAAGPDNAYAAFLDQRKAFGRSPAFYLDCADYFVTNGQRSLGVRVLTDVAELQLQDARLLRVAAHRLMQIGERDTAIDLFEKVLALRPEEPQSYRDLALALAGRADAVGSAAASRAVADYTRALELLNKVVVGEWPRFPEVELPVLMEANAVAAKARRLPDAHDFRNPIDARLQKNLDCDVRVVLTWDADQTDIDLWVTEPSGEKCFYGHNRTTIGGLLSRDYTDGYGPEEYCLRKLMKGQYNVQANYYGSRQQELTGPATVQATVITDFGRPTEKRQALTVRLKDAREVVGLGTVTLGTGEAKADPATRPAGEPNK